MQGDGGRAGARSLRIYRRRRNSPTIPAIPPPRTKPAAAAPISTCFWCRTICLRQSVASVTSPRRRSSECASSLRLASIEERISSGVRVGGISGPPLDRLLRPVGLDGVADALGLVDRHVGRRRRAALERAGGDEAGERADEEQHAGDEEEAPEERAVGDGERVVGEPREAV